MITRGTSPDTFLVDFAKARRTRKASLGASIESLFVRAPAPVTVDGHAIAQAICGVMDACDFADVQGRPWLWNEYSLFLARPDHDRLREVEELLRSDLLALLNEEIVRRDARMPEGFVVRLLVDEADELGDGRGVLRVRHRKDLAVAPAAPGEITMRADKIARPAPRPPDSTERDGGVQVRCGAGATSLAEGRPLVLGRAHPDNGPDVALPGASGKVSRRHVSVTVRGGEAEFTRLLGSNPVEVGGRALAEGESALVALPAELSLGGGAWRGTVAR